MVLRTDRPTGAGCVHLAAVTMTKEAAPVGLSVPSTTRVFLRDMCTQPADVAVESTSICSGVGTAIFNNNDCRHASCLSGTQRG